MPDKRPPTTARDKVNCLLHYVHVQFGEYLKCRLTGEDMKPGDDRVQFDHTGAWIHTKKHSWKRLRPVLNSKEGHKKKTREDTKAKRKGDRLVKEGRGEPKRKRPKRKIPKGPPLPKGQKLPNGRKLPKGQKIRSRNSFRKRTK